MKSNNLIAMAIIIGLSLCMGCAARRTNVLASNGTGAVTAQSYNGAIEVDEKCTTANVYDQTCFANAFSVAAALQTIHISAHTYNLTGSGTEIILQDKPLTVECDPAAVLLVASSVPNSTDIWHWVANASNPGGWRMRGCNIQYINGTNKSVMGATNAAPIVVTITGHGLSTGNVVQCVGIGGNTHGNGTWVITNTGANTFSLNGSVGNAAYSSGGTCSQVPGGYGLHVDVSNGSIISDFALEENAFGQGGKPGLYFDNLTNSQDGIFTGNVDHNIIKGGVKFDNLGDSVDFNRNILTGGFDAFVGSIKSAAAAVGAHHVTFTKNNMTNQGCAAKITNGSFMQFTGNNSEPTAGLSQGGPDTTNCSNNAAFDLDCTMTSPCYGVHVLDNTQSPSPDAFGYQNAFRCNWCVGAIFENNHPELSVGGQKAYIATTNAKNTQVYIPVQENGATCSTLMTIGNASTQVFFQSNFTGGAIWEVGCAAGISNSLWVREGTAQTQDSFGVFKSGGTGIFEVFPSHVVAVGGGADNGNTFQVTGGETVSGSFAVTSATSQIISQAATGTAPLVIASATTVPNLTASNHPKMQTCGTTSTCSHRALTSGQIVIGNVALSRGTATVTGISPAFTSSTSFECASYDATRTANANKCIGASASSVTCTGTGGDVIHYVCAGN
jgi:hypothetical protein